MSEGTEFEKFLQRTKQRLSEGTPFETFMQRTMQRPLPQNPMTRIRVLAKELAEGAAIGLWGFRSVCSEGSW